MLNKPFRFGMDLRTIDFLSRCQDPDGGYGGGPGQMAHLATTYAAVNSLVTIGGAKALASINRDKVLSFLLRMKQPDGGFTMHEGGEVDVRGCYTAISVAHILDITVPEIVNNVADYILRCQTYEGGIGGEPGAEAHGGYTFCGLAALALINKVDVINLLDLVNWVVFCQGKVEGGFRGRTNKLVDGCYSFRQGGVFTILQQIMPELNRQQMADNSPLYTEQPQFVDSSLNTEEIPKHERASSSSTSTSNVTTEGGREAAPTSSGRSAEGTTSATPEELSGTEATGASSAHATDESIVRGSASELVTADQLFPVVDYNIKRAPISVTVEELEDDISVSSKEAPDEACDTREAQPSIVDQLLNENEQILYGPLYNTQALQGYILICCQVLDGGLRDKPGKSPDYYHTCYCLSGLTQAQSSASHRINAPPTTKSCAWSLHQSPRAYPSPLQCRSEQVQRCNSLL
ncbi:hypothetical protein KC19_8G123800 [Ceratodon purpureus]|uniref:Prenyltransferase alpha-alpha toroid domain-containing protein n=1 Tax=Ceratodon purpureus TaxID=3225 RepID=A0A8T0H1J0_CERPU|nr:hypothetical protein KC19_8G123800 [Ceratodon purpureus]